MDFAAVLEEVLDLLQRQGRVSYRALKLRFQLDDEFLAGIKEELLFVHAVQVKEEGPGLVWIGSTEEEKGKRRTDKAGNGEHENEGETGKRAKDETVKERTTKDSERRRLNAELPTAERRQLTVLFCDLVDSTALSTQLDPEDLRTVVQQYQQTCAAVIERHEGYIAQYLGDGLLVYFGYPVAHEDDARRAVRAGLEIIAAIQIQVPSPLAGKGLGEGATDKHLQVRIGIHSGLVVIGDIGASGRTEQLALGKTPNIAARLQGLADPNTVIISATTQRLIEGQFESQPFGSHLLKGIATPIAVYHVQSERQNASPITGKTTLTPLIGREQEVGLLFDRWEQAKDGRGQVVLLSGEPGIGKSRLAYTLREHVTREGSLLFEARCSPYHQHSAFYSLIDVLQRTLLFTRQDTDDEKVAKLEHVLALYDLQESVPLFTALLSLPTPSQYPPLTLMPQKQKEQTLEALVQLLIAQAEHQATVSVWEDLQWADPSSLEFLTLLIEQIPTSKLLLMLTFRPEFPPPWKPRSHISQLVLNRLGKKQVEAMIEKAVAGKTLPSEVIEQIRMKTDGVPLFVEELTKSVIESREQVTGDEGLGRKATDTLAIPATLQEALLARLDRLSTARQIAQLGATLGREFSHELLQAVAPLSEADLHIDLEKLVEAEILYQRGIGEQARYFFKHALIQDTAYQSLLKSTRQQYHQQIAYILEERFPQTKETHPELLAHHYTEATLIEQAIPYWSEAGQKASQRFANAEANNHLTRGLEQLKTLPDTHARAQQELVLQLTLGNVLLPTQGYAAPEVLNVHTRARELCLQVGDTPHLFPVLWGSWSGHLLKAELQLAREVGEQLLHLAERAQDAALLLEAHYALGDTLFWLGEFTLSRTHLEQAINLYDPHQHRLQAILYGQEERGVTSLAYAAWTLWHLGYGDQALATSHEALTLADKLAPPFSQAFALSFAAWFHLFRRESNLTREHAKATIDLSIEQGFSYWLALGTIFQGWALTEQSHGEEGMMQMQQGLAAYQAKGAELGRPIFLAYLAEAYGKRGQTDKGLTVLAEALALVNQTGERASEAELYRLKGELTLQKQLKVESQKLKVPNPQAEAEECFLKAIAIAQKQQAKSWELRAVMSLVRLQQHQLSEYGVRNTEHESRTTHHEPRTRLAEAHKLLSEVYNWFTEGFDTKDLQEARELLESLK